jgi:hypothetical protein
MIAVARVEKQKIAEVGFIPCVINPANQAVPVALESKEGQAVLDYVELVTREGCHNTRYTASKTKIGGFTMITAASFA